jgi:hypothetical protein
MISHNQRMGWTRHSAASRRQSVRNAMDVRARSSRPKTPPNWFDRFDSLNAQRGSAPWIVAERSLHGGRSLKFAMISHNQRMDWTRHVPASRRQSVRNAVDVRARSSRPKPPPNWFDRFDSLGPAMISHNQINDSPHRRAASRRASAGNSADIRVRGAGSKNAPNWFDRVGFTLIGWPHRITSEQFQSSDKLYAGSSFPGSGFRSPVSQNWFDWFDSLGFAMISHNQRMDWTRHFAASHRRSVRSAMDVRTRSSRSKTPPNWFDRFDSLGPAMISHNQRMDWPRHVPASEPTGRGAGVGAGGCPGKGGGPGKGRAAVRFATPRKFAPAPAAQKLLQNGLIRYDLH